MGQQPLLPVRMLNESVYCPRLFYLMWVSALFEPSDRTAAGLAVHARVDRPRLDGPPEGPRAVTAMPLASERLGLTAKLDLVELDGETAVPVDYKVGRPPPGGGLWPSDRVQISAQAMLLREAGYDCTRGVVWYNDARRRVDVPITDADVEATRRAVVRAREIADAPSPPPPLVDSPKCPRCALVGLCLPYETNLLAGREPRRSARLMVPDWDGRPLYVTVPGSRVGISGNSVEVRKDGEKLASIRLIDLDQLCLMGRGVQVSTAAIHTLISHDIPILFFSGGGWFKGVAHGLPGKNVEVRRRQVVVAATDSLRFARAFVGGKLTNQRTLLRRHADAAPDALVRMGALIRSAAEATSMPTLLGIEGMGARHYFGSFSQMIGADPSFFRFGGRTRRPPRDPVNAMLSFSYALLVKELTVAALAVGLDPYLGLYHQPRFGRPALALDVAEEFRPVVGDSVVLMAINNGEIRPAHFLGSRHGWGLTREGRSKLISTFERRLDVVTTHPLFGYRVSYRRLLHLQMRILARALMGDVDDYVAFTVR